MKSSIKTLLVLLALLLPALLFGLGDRPVYKIQEVRIAETAREMLISGDWVVPRYNGELRLQKPPLPYWVTGFGYQVGGVNETTVRLPAVIFGLFASILLFMWSRREAGAKVAVNTVLVMVASYIGIRYFRSGEADAMLLFFISASCLLGYDLLMYRHVDARRRALFGLLLGLGFLTKGPAALAIPLLTLLGLAVIEKRAARLRPSFGQVFSLPGLALLLVVAFGWYAWIVWRLPDIAQHFVGKQVDETFVSGTHAKPVWWYLAHWVEFFAPWGILLIPAGWSAWRNRGSGMPAHIRLAWVWLAVVFVLLTLTVNKQMQYALLFLPPLAIILGHYLEMAQGRFAIANRWLFGLFCVLALLAVGYAARHAGLGMMWWLALPAVPLALRFVLRAEEVSWPVLLVAAVTATAYLYSEAYLSKEPRKVAAQTLVAAAAGHAPLYQFQPAGNTLPGDGAISFYAARVVPPVKEAQLMTLLQQQTEAWLIASEVPAIAGIMVEVAAESGELKLYRLRHTQ